MRTTFWCLARISVGFIFAYAGFSKLNEPIENLRAVELGAVEAQSRIVDLDFAVAVAAKTRNVIIGQAQLGLLAQANFMQTAFLGVLDA